MLPAEKKRRAKRIRFYSEILPDGALCFDIGANRGNRVDAFLKANASLVVAIEPQALCTKELVRRFGANGHCVVREIAVGAKAGMATLYKSGIDTLSTFSPKYIEQMREIFKGNRWIEAESIHLTTLDQLIEEFGIPEFCKIDVEGYEREVLQGLSQRVGMLSFEFHSYRVDDSIFCVEHLNRIGMSEFNLSYGESLNFELTRWVPATEIQQILSQHETQLPVWGDIYAR